MPDPGLRLRCCQCINQILAARPWLNSHPTHWLIYAQVAVFVPGLCEDDDAAHVSLSNNRLSLGPRNGPPTVDRPLAGQAMGALECVVFGSAEVALVRCQKANLGEAWPQLFEGDSLLLRDAGDHDQHVWWRDEGEDFREPSPTFGNLVRVLSRAFESNSDI